MIESPTKPVAASPDDRPIVIGRVSQPDYYVLAHEAKSRGDHSRAVTLLAMAARDLGVEVFVFGDVLLDWDNHIEAVDRAWGEKQKQLAEQSQPAPNPVQMMRVSGDSLFIDAVMAYENDRPIAAVTLLNLVAHCIGFEGDWRGTVEDGWNRNFEGVHQSWVEEWRKLNG